jgi:hypothetical protein
MCVLCVSLSYRAYKNVLQCVEHHTNVYQHITKSDIWYADVVHRYRVALADTNPYDVQWHVCRPKLLKSRLRNSGQCAIGYAGIDSLRL